MAKRAKETAVYRDGFSCSVPADVVHKELERIRKTNDGIVEPAVVVDESRPEDAPIHPAFTWNDQIAAEEWRKDEARRLIRNVCVIRESEPDAKPQPCYIHTPAASGVDVPGYRSVAAVASDEELLAAAIKDALAQLHAWKTRFGWIKQLGRMSSMIDDVSREHGREIG